MSSSGGLVPGSEPVLVISAIVGVLQIVQALTITGISAGVHGVIAVVLVGLGAILARSQVVPTRKLLQKPPTA